MSTDLSPQNEELIQQIDEGTRQLREGEGIELRDETELRAFFHEIQAEGMKRYQAKKNAQ